MNSTYIFASIIIFLALLVLFFEKTGLTKKLFSGRSSENGKLPYKKKGYLLTAAEKEFYRVLSQVVEKHNQLLFAKVRLEAILWLPRGTENKFGLRNRIKSREIDFVLCDKENIKPLLVIELDDSSHEREDRVERDHNIDRILHDAELPILRQKVQASYHPNEVEEKILGFLRNDDGRK